MHANTRRPVPMNRANILSLAVGMPAAQALPRGFHLKPAFRSENLVISGMLMVSLVADWLPFAKFAVQSPIFTALVGCAIETWRMRKRSADKIGKRPMKVLALYSSLSLLLGGFSARHPLTQPQNARRNGISA